MCSSALHQEWKDSQFAAEGELHMCFEVGLLVDYMCYVDNNDRDAREAWQAIAHDEDSNKYRPTTLLQKVAVVRKVRARAPGGSWDETRKALVGMYGQSKSRTVSRWIGAVRGPGVGRGKQAWLQGLCS